MERLLVNTPTSLILRVDLYDSSVTTGDVLTGLAYNSSNLVISIAPDGAAGATALTKEDITTIGTWVSPTGAGYVGFKAVDATDMPGLYELHFHNTDLESIAGFHLSIHGAVDLKPRLLYVQMAGVIADEVFNSATREMKIKSIEIQPATDEACGAGLTINGNDTIPAIMIEGGSNAAYAIQIKQTVAGNGVNIEAAGIGVSITSSGEHGLYVEGADASNGVMLTGGAAALRLEAKGGFDGNAVNASGDGTGAALVIDSGATADAIRVTAAGGTALYLEGQDGSGLFATGSTFGITAIGSGPESASLNSKVKAEITSAVWSETWQVLARQYVCADQWNIPIPEALPEEPGQLATVTGMTFTDEAGDMIQLPASAGFCVKILVKDQGTILIGYLYGQAGGVGNEFVEEYSGWGATRKIPVGSIFSLCEDHGGAGTPAGIVTVTLRSGDVIGDTTLVLRVPAIGAAATNSGSTILFDDGTHNGSFFGKSGTADIADEVFNSAARTFRIKNIAIDAGDSGKHGIEIKSTQSYGIGIDTTYEGIHISSAHEAISLIGGNSTDPRPVVRIGSADSSGSNGIEVIAEGKGILVEGGINGIGEDLHAVELHATRGHALKLMNETDHYWALTIEGGTGLIGAAAGEGEGLAALEIASREPTLAALRIRGNNDTDMGVSVTGGVVGDTVSDESALKMAQAAALGSFRGLTTAMWDMTATPLVTVVSAAGLGTTSLELRVVLSESLYSTAIQQVSLGTINSAGVWTQNATLAADWAAATSGPYENNQWYLVIVPDEAIPVGTDVVLNIARDIGNAALGVRLYFPKGLVSRAHFVGETIGQFTPWGYMRGTTEQQPLPLDAKAVWDHSIETYDQNTDQQSAGANLHLASELSKHSTCMGRLQRSENLVSASYIDNSNETPVFNFGGRYGSGGINFATLDSANVFTFDNPAPNPMPEWWSTLWVGATSPLVNGGTLSVTYSGEPEFTVKYVLPAGWSECALGADGAFYGYSMEQRQDNNALAAHHLVKTGGLMQIGGLTGLVVTDVSNLPTEVQMQLDSVQGNKFYTLAEKSSGGDVWVYDPTGELERTGPLAYLYVSIQTNGVEVPACYFRVGLTGQVPRRDIVFRTPHIPAENVTVSLWVLSNGECIPYNPGDVVKADFEYKNPPDGTTWTA